MVRPSAFRRRDRSRPAPLLETPVYWAILTGQPADILAAAERHDLTAMRLVGAADAIRTAVGSRLDPAAQNRLDQRLAPAGARLGERRAAEARATGASLSWKDADHETQAFLERRAQHDQGEHPELRPAQGPGA
jgi:hypothetical protein